MIIRAACGHYIDDNCKCKGTFTDADLKRLKEHGMNCGFRSAERLQALIARLEAAENVCALNLRRNNLGCWNPMHYALKAWRKAAGK